MKAIICDNCFKIGRLQWESMPDDWLSLHIGLGHYADLCSVLCADEFVEHRKKLREPTPVVEKEVIGKKAWWRR